MPVRAAAGSVSVQDLLAQGRRSIGAASCVLYIRDPDSPGELRLAAMDGVRCREAMHGPLLPTTPAGSMAGAASGVPEQWITSARLHELRPAQGPVPEDPLLEGFVGREGVRALALLRHLTAGEVEAALWVNFSKKASSFPEARKKGARALFAALIAHLPALRSEAAQESRQKVAARWEALAQAVRGLGITPGLGGTPEIGEPVTRYLADVLARTLEAFGILTGSGFGSVYLLDASGQHLRKAVQQGNANPQGQQVFALPREGIVAWVAQARTPLLIEQLADSPFKKYYVSIDLPGDARTVSQLVVPLLSRDRDLVGVLNIESKREKCPFSSADVRLLCALGRDVAFACRAFQHASSAFGWRSARLLEIARKTAVGAEEAGDDLAALARQWLGADHCNIWESLPQDGRFRSLGATYQRGDRSPRDDGWTRYVMRSKAAVWLRHPDSPAQVEVWAWSEQDECWASPAEVAGLPSDVSEDIAPLNASCQLGLPVCASGECLGVAWLKWRPAETPAPSAALMGTAWGLAAAIGLVIEDRHLRDLLAQQGREAQDVQEINSTIFPTGPVDFLGLEGYVINQPHGAGIGGDLYAVQDLGKSRVCFLIGDGEKHGMLGAMAMLPMVTTFKWFATQLSSTKEIISRLAPICETLGTRGTALCFLLDGSGDQPVLFASSAGHPPLMIVSKGGQNRDFPDPASMANRGQLGVEASGPLAEAYHPLCRGDLIIAYTDGVSDANKMPPFGRAGILQAVLRHSRKPPEGIARGIEAAARAFANDRLHDDFTILVLRVK